MKSKKMNLQWAKSVALLFSILVLSRLGVYAIACVLLILTLSLATYFYLKSDDKESEVVRKPKPLQFGTYKPIPFNRLKLEELRSMNPYQFESYIASMYRQLGYSNAKQTKKSNDNGRDVEMNDDVTGQLYFVECKRYKGKVSRDIAQKLAGACSVSNAKGIIVTTGRYTQPALEYCKLANIECVTREQLLYMIERAEEIERQNNQRRELTELNTSASSN